MKILVLGGYGLIGLAITRALIAAGHEVTGLGRSVQKGRAAAPEAGWIGADLSLMTDAVAWAPVLRGIEVVINAAGVLQDGLKDRVAAVQRDSILALTVAGREAGVRQLIQISAPGVSETSDTEFFRTKAAADAAVKASGLDWVILRPGLVLSPHAYGGTGLIRQLAAFPLVQPLMLSSTPVQTVHVDDVANAVTLAVNRRLAGIDADLVGPDVPTLGRIVLAFREWLGFPRPARLLRVPYVIGAAMARLGDAAGWLGWRPALRTTSLRVLARGVTGNADAWPAATGQSLRMLDDSLAALPSTLQERTYARMALLFPLLLIVLSGFWIASGLIGFWRQDAAAELLAGSLPPAAAKASVLGGSAADLAIGLGLLVRPLTRPAAIAAILLSLCYLGGSIFFAPHLWADPLGPMVKAIPAMALALAVWAMAEAR